MSVISLDKKSEIGSLELILKKIDDIKSKDSDVLWLIIPDFF